MSTFCPVDLTLTADRRRKRVLHLEPLIDSAGKVGRAASLLPEIESRYDRPMQRSMKAQTTLGDLHRATPWLWLHCERCQHHAPLACAVAVIRWGRDASSDVLRERARCTACGNKGATIQHPGWGGADIGFLPFSTERSVSTLP